MTSISYDAILFDLYGTLVDIRTDESDPALWRDTAFWYAQNGAPWDPNALREAYLTEVRRLEAQSPAAYPEIDLGCVFFALYQQKGVTPDAQTVADTAWRFRQTSTRRLRLYAGARPLLHLLRQSSKVILLSNAQRLFTVPELELLGLKDAFDRIYLSSDCGCKKPDPAFFRLPLQSFGLDPKRCIMVGNDPYADAAGAKSVDMRSLCIRSAISPQNAPSDCYDLMRMDLRRVQRILTGCHL